MMESVHMQTAGQSALERRGTVEKHKVPEPDVWLLYQSLSQNCL
jgi:hypothetical protein